jgi:hypothetical protein
MCCHFATLAASRNDHSLERAMRLTGQTGGCMQDDLAEELQARIQALLDDVEDATAFNVLQSCSHRSQVSTLHGSCSHPGLLHQGRFYGSNGMFCFPKVSCMCNSYLRHWGSVCW